MKSGVVKLLGKKIRGYLYDHDMDKDFLNRKHKMLNIKKKIAKLD